MTIKNKLTICIDRGGTFTDCIGFLGKPENDDYKEFVIKLLSEDPSNYKDAPTEGIRRIVELATGEKIPRSQPVPTRYIGKNKTRSFFYSKRIIIEAYRKRTHGNYSCYKRITRKKRRKERIIDY